MQIKDVSAGFGDDLRRLQRKMTIDLLLVILNECELTAFELWFDYLDLPFLLERCVAAVLPSVGAFVLR